MLFLRLPSGYYWARASVVKAIKAGALQGDGHAAHSSPPRHPSVALAGASIIAATPVTPPLPDVQVPAVQLTSATSSLDLLASADPSLQTPNVAVSVDGFTLLQLGSATATSGTGDLAIALGRGSDATATAGNLDFATALGTQSVAEATNGNLDTSMRARLNRLINARTPNLIAGTEPMTVKGSSTTVRAVEKSLFSIGGS